MILDDTLRRHDVLEFALTDRRPPGHETARCSGRIHRVDCARHRIPDETGPDHDAAQRGEGEPHENVDVFFFACEDCPTTLVVARCPDGKLRLRNARPTGAEADEAEARAASVAATA